MTAATLDHATLQQAAHWFARLSDEPVAHGVHEAWCQWHAQSERNRLAWCYVERVSQRFAPLQGDAAGAAQTLEHLRHTRRSRRQVLRSLSIVLGGAMLGWAGWRQRWLPDALTTDYHTGTAVLGAQRLADGTQVWLNSGTALDVDYSATQRTVRLYAGEVLINTGRDPRPFSVETAQGHLQPLGTRFSVRERGERTELSVFEGQVKATAGVGGDTRVVAAGQALAFDAQRLFATEPARLERQAWAQGVLLANDTRLADFIAELATYRHGHLGVDPRVADLRVMGTYPLHDTDQVLSMLEHVLPVRLEHTLPWWVTVVPR